MKNPEVQVTVNWSPDFDNESMQEKVKNAIVDKMVSSYMGNIEESFQQKLEDMIIGEAQKLIQGMSKIYVDTCNKDGIKESVTIDQFIIDTAVKSLTTKVDKNGNAGSGYGSSSDKRTPVAWFIKETLDKGTSGFSKELKQQCQKIQADYEASLEKMINKTLAPLYKKLREQVKS